MNVSEHGGLRTGAGRPPGPQDPERAKSKADYDFEKARHEKIKADQAEFDYAVTRGQFVARTAVVQASATAMAVLAQSLRSLRDNLERKKGLPPEVLDTVAAEVDDALESAGRAFQALAVPETPAP